ncbi:MAG: metallophosphoesterase [Opitutaceae bacterium]
MIEKEPKRIIAIGDVHGCARELEQLITRANPRPRDRIIFLGDLVNRGPDSRAVVRMARDLKAQSLIGNHEVRLLHYHNTGQTRNLKPHDYTTIKQLADEDWAYLTGMKDRIYIRKLDTVLVHGGFHPHQAWQTQPRSVITEIQTIDAAGRPQRRSKAPDAPVWADFWSGPPFVIYGHTPRPEIYRTPSSLGIDTACVLGGKLTACILPDMEIIQVPAAKAYFP